MLTRRKFIQTSTAIAGGIAVMPMVANAAGHSGVMSFADGAVKIHPVSHASLVIETPMGVIYVDPVGDVAQYKGMPSADLVLITHHHGDHLNNNTLAAVMGPDTVLISNQGAADKMAPAFAAEAKVIANGESTDFAGINIEAIAAYNVTEERKKFHPMGRDNGYVLNIGKTRVYVSSDTEDTPEMRGLENIDVALLCMNLPFTMDIKQAASAVSEFKPGVVIPYHYRGRDGGTQDPIAFAQMLSDEISVQQGDWYGKGAGQI